MEKDSIISNEHPPQLKHALVIGGGLAGLLAARVLADTFEQVTILERDHYPNTPQARKGVPQSNHMHGLMARGWQIFTRLYPPLQANLEADGVYIGDALADTITYGPSHQIGYLVRPKSRLTFPACSRITLEWHIRQCTLAIENISTIEQCEAIALLADETGQTINGVEIRYRPNAQKEGIEHIHGDFIVDASGRQSKSPQWLTALGFETPEEVVVDAKLGYASCFYHAPKHFQGDWRTLTIMPHYPTNPRAGVLRRIEGNLWQAMAIALANLALPADGPEFVAFSQQMPSPIIYQAIQDLDLASPIYRFRNTTNRRRYFERLSQAPENFIAVGDAFCCYNPFYGFGMTGLALCSEILEQSLASHLQHNKHLQGFSHKYHQILSKGIDPLWALVLRLDDPWLETNSSKLSLMQRLKNHINAQIVPILFNDEDKYIKTMEARHQLRPTSDLVTPDLLLKVIGRSFSPFSSKTPATEPITHPDLGLS